MYYDGLWGSGPPLESKLQYFEYFIGVETDVNDNQAEPDQIQDTTK